MFLMKHEYGWGLEEMESLLPWERQIYVTMLQKSIEQENEKVKQRNALIRQGKR